MIEEPREGSLLLRVTPEQVSNSWEWFAPVIEMSMPPEATGRDRHLAMANVLKAILVEDLQVWAFYYKEELAYVASTTVREEKVSLSRDLLIYSFSSLRTLKVRDLHEGLFYLRKYAKKRQCESLIAYTDNSQIVDLFSRLGHDTSQTLIKIGV